MPSQKPRTRYAKGKHPNSLKNLHAPGAPPVAEAAEQGNRRAMTHGGYENPHRQRLQAVVGEIFDILAEDAPVRAADGSLPRHDTVMVTLLATTLCRLENVDIYLAAHDWDAKAKRPRESVMELETRLRREAADYLDALGMTPKSRARLGVDLVRARDLAQEWSNAAIDGTASDG